MAADDGDFAIEIAARLLAPSTKEAVAAHAADVCKLESGKWYGMVVEADSNSEDDGA